MMQVRQRKNLNHKQRQYRKRNIPQNKEALVIAEVMFENEKEKAMNNWSERLVDQINTSRIPKGHFPELYKFAGENLIEAIRSKMTVTAGLEDSKHHIPEETRKTNYFSPSSYRPISLTSVMCKITERIVLNRLTAFIEGMKLIEEKQEGFNIKLSDEIYPKHNRKIQ
ncbi:unnamed protein product [Mytilus coruscus]|uniref:Reverse transcriptase domain-containing protein n=1 Tax=Mytilus coruscus TaxID=42192 RepID=A0A6J8B047_MYTCO|nr:unnamed protein product [Mytilus coruscus]